ncbi:TniQ family protein [Actinoplanes sp. NPDC026670]|uniref:TniQ family protein n=1 Tax=Actinoplanes sp. NPDC026670 TaxID=3154700 RepID=UPI0033CB2082
MRTLPIRLPVASGEALESWLIRLATRNRISALQLANVLGLTQRGRRSPRRDIPAESLRRVENQAGLAPGTLDTTVATFYQPTGWPILPAFRFCAVCLRTPGMPWPNHWRLPYLFTCHNHRVLLRDSCPACGKPPRLSWTHHAGLNTGNICTTPTANRNDICGTDLSRRPPRALAPDDPRLAAQDWIAERLQRLGGDDAIADLRNLHVLVAWLHGEPARGTPAVAAAILRSRSLRGRQNITRVPAATAAALTAEILPILDGGRAGASQPTPLLLKPQGPFTNGYLHRLAALTPDLRARALVAADRDLPTVERLRHRTCTLTPHLADPTTNDLALQRIRHVPEKLWPDWSHHLAAPTGPGPLAIAAHVAPAILIPGSACGDLRAATQLRAWTKTTAQVLHRLASENPGALHTICAIADYLDTVGSPIDYQRRRHTFTDVTEPPELGRAPDDDLGRETRQLHTRRYIFALLTGANLGSPNHAVSFRTSQDSAEYVTFEQNLDRSDQHQLRAFAADLLQAAGIREPLTWSPPFEEVGRLPGNENA